MDIPQNLGKQIVLKVLNAILLRSSENMFYLNPCRTYAVKKIQFLITEMRKINL